MKFARIDQRHYKRVYVKGSNQYRKRKKLSIKGFLALGVFALGMGAWGFSTVYAATPEIVSPLPKDGQLNVATVSATPTEVERFMALQAERNVQDAEWKKWEMFFRENLENRVARLEEAK